jgi:hypothetical protein
VPERLKIIAASRRATQEELRSFKSFWVDRAQTQVVAMTQDEELAKRFKHYRWYWREQGVKEYEVVFMDALSVRNALKVLG